MENAPFVDYHGLTEWTTIEAGGKFYAVPGKVPDSGPDPWECEHCGTNNGPWVASCGGCGMGWKGREVIRRWTDFQILFPEEFVRAHEPAAFCRYCGLWTPPDWDFCAHCKGKR
jgi:hypothetical protein